MSETLQFELIKISPFILFIFLISWWIYSLIMKGKIKGKITFGDNDSLR